VTTVVNHSDVLRHAQRGCAPSRYEKHALCARKREFDLAANYKFGTVGARRRDGCRQQDGKAEIFEHNRFSLFQDFKIMSNAETSWLQRFRCLSKKRAPLTATLLCPLPRLSEADQVVPSLFILASFSTNMHKQ
jgi:hypothetical protein